MSEPVTVMETRFRLEYRNEDYTVLRPVSETSYVERPYTVTKPVYQTVNQERAAHGFKAGLRDRASRATLYRVANRFTQTVNHENAPVSSLSPRDSHSEHQERRLHRAAGLFIKTVNQERRHTVMKAVYQTEARERRLHGDESPSIKRSTRNAAIAVMRPVYETSHGGSELLRLAGPVTTVRQEVRECGYYARQYTMVPGPVVERRVRVPVVETSCNLHAGFLVASSQPQG